MMAIQRGGLGELARWKHAHGEVAGTVVMAARTRSPKALTAGRGKSGKKLGGTRENAVEHKCNG